MKVYGDPQRLDLSDQKKYMPLEEFRSKVDQGERALDEINAHPSDKRLVLVALDGVQSFQLFNARIAGDSDDLIGPDLNELAKQEREVARQAASIAAQLATTPEEKGLTAEEVLHMIATSVHPELTTKAVRLVMNGGALVGSQEGLHCAPVARKMKGSFDAAESHQLTVSVLAEVGDGQTLHMRLHQTPGNELFWKQYNRRTVTMKALDQADYQSLLLARISGQQLNVKVGVVLHLPKNKTDNTLVTCTLIDNLDHDAIANEAVKWINLQYNLEFLKSADSLNK